MAHQSVESQVDKLNCDPQVQSLSMNSASDEKQVPGSLNEANKGRALMIFNNFNLFPEPTRHAKTISQERAKTLFNAKRVLADHFGLQVSNKI